MPSVVLCVSGGVDSCVSAHLLKKQGFNVTALFLRLTDTQGEKQALKNTKHILKYLDCPLKIIDKRWEFSQFIINYFEKSYLLGKTPNVCVICNPLIKFNTALKVAREKNIDFVATGHYCRIFRGKNTFLIKAQDKKKDQSYFLHQIKKEALSKIIFPIGHLTKKQTIQIAQQIGILQFIQAESQDICFFKGDYRQFLKQRLKRPFASGPIITSDGKILGEHKGLVNYTVGQRRGLGLSDKTPYYVLKIDINKNVLVVGKENELFKKEFCVKNVNWLLHPKGNSMRCKVKIRSRHKAAKATLQILKDNKVKVVFDNAQRAITPGQFAVFYKGLVVIGGGEICA